MHATIRFRQQRADDRVEVFDACERHADYVRQRLLRRADEAADVLAAVESTPPGDAACPHDRPGCAPGGCGQHDGLIMAAVEDGQLMGTS